MASPVATERRPLASEIERRLTLAPDLPSRLEHPNLPATREAAVVFRDCFRSLSSRVDLADATAHAIEHEALYRSFDAFLAFRSGEAALTASCLLETWTSRALADLRSLQELEVSVAEALEQQLEWLRETLPEMIRTASGLLAESVDSLSGAARSLAGTRDHTEWLVLFHQAVEQVVALDLGADRARPALRSLMTRLELSQDDLGRMFGVAGETVRRWERGATGIPAARRSQILAAESELRRLQDLFLPERLPTVVRKPAELFDDETAMAWILRGRIADVAERYEAALLYQA